MTLCERHDCVGTGGNTDYFDKEVEILLVDDDDDNIDDDDVDDSDDAEDTNGVKISFSGTHRTDLLFETFFFTSKSEKLHGRVVQELSSLSTHSFRLAGPFLSARSQTAGTRSSFFV